MWLITSCSAIHFVFLDKRMAAFAHSIIKALKTKMEQSCGEDNASIHYYINILKSLSLG